MLHSALSEIVSRVILAVYKQNGIIISYVSDASPYKHILRRAQLLLSDLVLDEQSPCPWRSLKFENTAGKCVFKIPISISVLKELISK